MKRRRLGLDELLQDAPYSYILNDIIEELGGYEEILRLKFDPYEDGYVDIDILLNNGQVYCINYNFVLFDNRYYSEEEIRKLIISKFHIFETLDEYDNFNEKKERLRLMEEEERTREIEERVYRQKLERELWDKMSRKEKVEHLFRGLKELAEGKL